MEPLKIKVEAPQSVSGLLLNPPDARACFVLAHGAGMTHLFMDVCRTAVMPMRAGPACPRQEREIKRPGSGPLASGMVSCQVRSCWGFLEGGMRARVRPCQSR